MTRSTLGSLWASSIKLIHMNNFFQVRGINIYAIYLFKFVFGDMLKFITPQRCLKSLRWKWDKHQTVPAGFRSWLVIAWPNPVSYDFHNQPAEFLPMDFSFDRSIRTRAFFYRYTSNIPAHTVKVNPCTGADSSTYPVPLVGSDQFYRISREHLSRGISP